MEYVVFKRVTMFVIVEAESEESAIEIAKDLPVEAWTLDPNAEDEEFRAEPKCRDDFWW